MKLRKSGLVIPFGGHDNQPQGFSERDAILDINKEKKVRLGNNDVADSDSKDSDPENSSKAVIVGSDNGTPPVEEKPADPTPPPAPQGIDLAALGKIISDSINAAITPIKDELQSTKDKLSETETKLTESDAKTTAIADLFNKETGNPNPESDGAKKVNFNTKFGVGDGLKGAASDFVNILYDPEQTRTSLYVDGYTNQRYLQRDYSNLRRFFRKDRDAIRADMEFYAKKNGLLQGWKDQTGSDAATLKTDIPDAFLAYLSMVMRETHSPTYIYWQFAFEGLELGKGAGDTIKVPRFTYLPSASAIADRQLTPGTATTSSNQNLSMGTVTVALEELGLGKGAGSEPVAIPEFINAWSLVNLENALQSRIGHDWEDYTDFRLRSLLFSSTRVVYNDRSSVVTSPGSVASDATGGTITLQFLNNLYAYMRALKIPTYQNGKYGIAFHTTALAQLKNDLSPDSFELNGTVADIANLLNGANGGEMERVSGYHGDIGGFMIFETNAHSLGAAGTEGAQNETIGIGSRVTRTSLAFGRNAVAKAVGMTMEVRRDANDDFGRLNRYIWLEHAGYGGLDIDPARSGGGANEQLRVIQVRTTDQPANV